MSIDRYARIDAGVVATVIESDTDPDGFAGAEWVLCTDAGPGWLYDQATGLFSPPAAAAVDRRVSYRAALSRFTVEEWTRIELFSIWRAADDDATALQRGYVRTSLTRLAACAATFVDLDDQAVADGLALFVGLGLLDEQRPAEILGPDPAPNELPGMAQ